MHAPTVLAMMVSISITVPLAGWVAVGMPRRGGGVYWFLGAFCGGVGVGVVLIRSFFPSIHPFIGDQLTNFGVFLALLLRWRAMEEQLGKPCPWTRVAIDLAVFGGILSALYLLELDIARSVFLSLLYAYVAWQLFLSSRKLYREMPTLAVGLCVVFSFLLLVSFSGTAMISLQGHPFRAIGPGHLISAIAFISFGASVMTNFVWVGVVSFRANQARQQQLLEYERGERQAHISRELARVEAKNSIEVMSTGLAHELGQPLAAMLTAAQLCRRMVADGLVDNRSAAALLESILSSVSRATAIIEKTRITHASALGLGGVSDVAETIKQSVLLGSAEADAAHVQVSVIHPEAPLRARIDPVHLSQVLANVLRNAVQALVNSPIRQVFVRAEPVGKSIRITVTDTGPGISTATLDKVGNLFFTTRQEGLGMGLAVCREILAGYGGTLELQNVATGGLRVTLEVLVDAA
jgi:signal transduction histidine kinase